MKPDKESEICDLLYRIGYKGGEMPEQCYTDDLYEAYWQAGRCCAIRNGRIKPKLNKPIPKWEKAKSNNIVRLNFHRIDNCY